MGRMRGLAVAAMACAVMSVPGVARGQHAAAPNKAASDAFAQYDKIHDALATDSLAGVADAATALAPLAAQLAGQPAADSAKKVAAAKDLKDARAAFGTLSEQLVPKFMAADLPGVHGFMCPMVNKPWAQRSATVQNPYYGKAMPGCGNEITPKKK